jgi:hypothetical protein
MNTVSAIIERVSEQAKPSKAKPKQKASKPIPSLPPMKDSEVLEKYLLRWQTAFERSITGAILDMARDKAFTSRKCINCGGTGVMGAYEDALKLSRIPINDSDSKPILKALAELFRDCPKCHGAGAVCKSRGSGVLKFSKDAPFEPVNFPDAKPRKGSEYSTKEPPPDDVLIQYARTSRRLMCLLPSHREALCAAYGPEGQSWADDKRTRVWAVLRCTGAGRRLIQSDPGLNPDKRLSQRLTEIADIQEQSNTPSKTRGKQLQDAIYEASILLGAAIDAWNSTFPADSR